MQVVSVKKALGGSVAADTKVEIRGWVRTRRDSKAGISFINVSDGSTFDPIQVVAPSTLPNYAKEILHLTSGASVICRGTLVPSQGKGQAFEMQADEVQVLGLVDDPDTYPIQPKQHSLEFLREVAHLRVAHQHVRRHHPRAPLGDAGHPPLLPRGGLLLGEHAHHHRQRRRGRRADVPRVHPGRRQPAAHAGREDRLAQGLLRQARPTSPCPGS